MTRLQAGRVRTQPSLLGMPLGQVSTHPQSSAWASPGAAGDPTSAWKPLWGLSRAALLLSAGRSLHLVAESRTTAWGQGRDGTRGRVPNPQPCSSPLTTELPFPRCKFTETPRTELDILIYRSRSLLCVHYFSSPKFSGRLQGFIYDFFFSPSQFLFLKLGSRQPRVKLGRGASLLLCVLLRGYSVAEG